MNRNKLTFALKEIWKFAKSQDAVKSGPHLADLLEIFTSFMDEKSSLEILKKMGEAPAEVSTYRNYGYAWGTPKSRIETAGGCSTEKRKEAILAAVRAFEWAAVMDAVLGLVSKTGEADLEHAAALAMALKVWIDHKSISEIESNVEFEYNGPGKQINT